MDAEKEALIQQTIAAAAASLASGQSRKDVLSSLLQLGIPEPAALAILARAQELKRAARRKEGFKTMLAGLGLIALGGAITAATYFAAPAFEGHYLVMRGLFFVGFLVFLKGVWRSLLG